MKQAIAIMIICLFLSSPLIGISKPIDESNQEITASDNGPMNSAWPTYGQNNQHTGQSPYNTRNNPMNIKWKFETKYLGFESSPVIDQEGTLYISADDNNLYSIFSDGTEKWCFNLNGWSSDSPAISEDGTIYIGSWDYKLYAINSDGTLKWKFDAHGGIYSSPIIGDDGTIFFGVLGPAQIGRVYAINPDGTEKWHIDVGDYVYCTPAIAADGTVYISSNDRYLYALNPINGSIIWRFQTRGDLGEPSIGEDGTIYIPSHDHFLYALNPDGSLKWKTEIGTGSSDTPVIGNDGTIYIGELFFYAINPDGSIKWIYQGWDQWEYEVTSSTYAISADELIYFVATKQSNGNGGDLFVLNCNDGTLYCKKNIAPNGYQYSQPVIGMDGTIYIGSEFVSESTDGYLYAFGEIENNQPPNKPEINGPITGKINVEYDYIFTVSDNDNDEIYLYVEWGDESNNGWLGPFESDEEIVISHSWNQQGSYNLKAKTKDEHEVESDWSTLEITMPKSKISFFFNQCINDFPILKIIFRGII